MRRILSVARLTVREAAHNKVLISCAVFAILLILVRLAIFAVGGNDLWIIVEQFTRIALALVLLTGVVVTILLCAPSLSQDIRSKVIHTVIPKPIHRFEILLGKVLGFAATVAVLFVVMGAVMLAVSLLTVPRRDRENQRPSFSAEVKVPPTAIRFAGGFLSYMKRSDRRWLNPDFIETEADRKERELLGTAKVIPGRAIVSFGRIRPRDLGGQPLRFEFMAGVYRFGGAAGEAAEISITIINRETGERYIIGRRGPTDEDREPFTVRENEIKRLQLPVSFIGDGAPVDLVFRNLAYKHRVGMKRTDVALLVGDRSYVLNLVKGLLILYLEVFLVVVIAVMSSTFLSGLVAILFTTVVWMGGHMMGWMGELLTKWGYGGQGPLAEISREFGRTMYAPEGPMDWVFDFTNTIFRGVLKAAASLFPNLGQFDGAWLLARNVDIGWATVGRAAQFSLLYSAICFVIAYAAFRVKEVAR